MANLQKTDFRQYFQELHGKNPFPWQEVLAERVCTTGWPDVIDLPTASGKTACIDIALFALALRGAEVPRRVFFVVDRRVVVNEAFLRVQGICETLSAATTGKLAAVRSALAALAGGDDPLRVYEMRGGAFRDETWVRNPRQPTVVASTVDQVGSRLLFRGYGVRDYSWPIHAGLIANDALIILDEAHCSRAFAQTLARVEKYRGDSWAEEPLGVPFQFVEMTATPWRDTGEFFRITDADRGNETFAKRLYASKPTRLFEAKCKKGNFDGLVNKLITEATELATEAGAKRIAIIVNRVATANKVYDQLREKVKDAAVELVIGRMRPVDRDDLYERKLKSLKSDVQRRSDDPLTYVVSTQCLEVGADLDFDVLVTECASIDALQQRFGRLDRLGDFRRARGAVVITSWQVDAKEPDPVYGNAISKTWEWLKSVSNDDQIDMGIEAASGQPATAPESLKAVNSAGMRMQPDDAPVLLPAHLDTLVQTSPVPEPDPAVELFLHGPERSVADVQVVWRADLDGLPAEEWEEIVRLCPPSSREAMPVPIYAFKRWFAGVQASADQESDLPIGVREREPEQNRSMQALTWRDDKSALVQSASEVRPGDTLVLPVSASGWEELGHIPDDVPIDVGDRASYDVRRTVSLRLHPKVMQDWPKTESLAAVVAYATELNAEPGEMKSLLIAYLAELDASKKPWPYDFLSRYEELQPKMNSYPTEGLAYVLQGRKPDRRRQQTERVFLDAHSENVEKAAAEADTGIDGNLKAALQMAARFHDYGKSDVRFQAWLLGGDRMAAQYAPKPVAKSGLPLVRKPPELPNGFRHELLSLMFAERATDLNDRLRDLILHLVASHHGRCRPFAPVIADESPVCVSCGGISICKREREEFSASSVDSGISERFWNLTRHYGWWGLAYLEALFRLADWKASENEGTEVEQ